VIPIYPKPHNEEQRNSNARFVRLDWVEGIADKSLNLKLSAEQIIDKVAERAFSIQLVRAMIEGLKTNKLNFYMRLVK
jgi:F0F1-type ATP synthase gamma subunit